MAALTKSKHMACSAYPHLLNFSRLLIFAEKKLLFQQTGIRNSTRTFTQRQAGSHVNSNDNLCSGVYVRCYCSATTRTCWNCRAALPGHLSGSGDTKSSSVAFFCVACNVIQPLHEALNHFQILGIEEKFDVDIADLKGRFRSLQRVLHPDKFGNTSKTEQNFSALQSSAVNRAYKVLLKPLSRGMYLLELNGHSIEEGESSIDPAFLVEVIEVNEELANTEDLAAVHRIGKDNSVKMDALLDEMRSAFNLGNFLSARETLMRLKYYANIDDRVKEKLGTK